MTAASMMYKAGESLYPVAATSQVAMYGAVPPNSETAMLYGIAIAPERMRGGNSSAIAAPAAPS